MSWYKDAHLKFIIEKYNEQYTWEEITEEFNKKFSPRKAKTKEALRKFFENNYKKPVDDDLYIKNIKESFSTRKSNLKLRKNQRVITENLLTQDELLKACEDILKEFKPKISTVKKLDIDKTKDKMIIEPCLSDIHYGKLTNNFNIKKCRERVRKFTNVLTDEIKRYSKNYNIEKIMVALLGDIIESETMHGLESARSCEFGNSEQIRVATESLFEDFLLPLSQIGIPIKVNAVRGNHDRVMPNKTFNDPGKHDVTWIIYNLLSFMSKKMGLNIEFNIPEGFYATDTIFKDVVLYEHYDVLRSLSKKTLSDLMAKRSKQIGKVLSFIRGGHFHEYWCLDRGAMIVNASVCGQDSYADVLGFKSTASQTINYYVDPKNKKRTSFYHSFPVYLGE